MCIDSNHDHNDFVLQVAICAGCNAVAPWGALVIGVLSGFTYLFWSWMVIKLKVDDPIDAVAGM